jgi:hyperosmotically inducible protein
MTLQNVLCGTAVALVLVTGCKREEATSTAAPATPQPAERPSTAAPPAGTTPTTPSESRSVGQTLDDATITAKIKASLLQAPDVKGTDVNVDTVNGTVTLKGAVQSQEQANRAVQIAHSSEGVKEVVSRLAVKPKP